MQQNNAQWYFNNNDAGSDDIITAAWYTNYTRTTKKVNFMADSLGYKKTADNSYNQLGIF